MNTEIIKFVNGNLQLDVTVSPDKETVWLNRNQLAQLFDGNVKEIGKHINNTLKEEFDRSTIAAFKAVVVLPTPPFGLQPQLLYIFP